MPMIQEKTLFLQELEEITSNEQDLLGKQGYYVAQADFKNLDDLINTDVKLIIVSLNAGNHSGVLQEAAAISAEHSIPILFLSSTDNIEVMEKAQEISTYGYVIKDSGGVALLFAVRTACKIIETEENEQTYNKFYGYSAKGLCTVKLLFDEHDKLKDCKHLFYNESFAEQTSLKPSFLTGKTVKEVYGNKEADFVPELFQEVINKGEPITREIYFQPLDSTFEITIVPLQDNLYFVEVLNLQEKNVKFDLLGLVCLAWLSVSQSSWISFSKSYQNIAK